MVDREEKLASRSECRGDSAVETSQCWTTKRRKMKMRKRKTKRTRTRKRKNQHDQKMKLQLSAQALR